MHDMSTPAADLRPGTSGYVALRDEADEACG